VPHVQRGLLAVAVSLALALLLAGCGSESDADQVVNAVRDTDHQAGELPLDPSIPHSDFTLPDGPSHDLRLPSEDQVGRPSPGQLVLSGEQEGHRAQVAGSGLIKKVRLSPEEQKHLTCFLTEKALDHNLAQSPEQVALEVGEYLGEDVEEHIPAYKYARAGEVFWEVAREIEFDGGLSKKTALEVVCG
jgi:hypothetical protein